MPAKPIKIDHVVRSADGSVYVVRYVHVGRSEADLSPLHENGVYLEETTTLPLSELRRIADPRNRKPPIEGMPDDRPRCAFCDRPFRFMTHNEYGERGTVGAHFKTTRRTFVRWSNYAGLFCTTRCAVNFGAAAHRAGYRITRKAGA